MLSPIDQPDGNAPATGRFACFVVILNSGGQCLIAITLHGKRFVYESALRLNIGSCKHPSPNGIFNPQMTGVPIQVFACHQDALSLAIKCMQVVEVAADDSMRFTD